MRTKRFSGSSQITREKAPPGDGLGTPGTAVNNGLLLIEVLGEELGSSKPDDDS